MAQRTRKCETLNLRVAPDVVVIVNEVTTEHKETYYQKDLVSMALRWFSKTLKSRRIKAGDDIEKKLGI